MMHAIVTADWTSEVRVQSPARLRRFGTLDLRRDGPPLALHKSSQRGSCHRNAVGTQNMSDNRRPIFYVTSRQPISDLLRCKSFWPEDRRLSHLRRRRIGPRSCLRCVGRNRRNTDQHHHGVTLNFTVSVLLMCLGCCFWKFFQHGC